VDSGFAADDAESTRRYNMTMKKVASVSDVPNGRIHGVTVDETDLILVRVEGEVLAFAGHCPHHEAPLKDGLLHGHRLVCPWHQAVFDITTGGLAEPPALDGLSRFAVEVRDDEVWVDLPKPAAQHERPTSNEEKRSGEDRTVVIVGAGAAGLAGALGLRDSGFQGRIVMLSAEADEPYDRTQCSKDYLAGEAPADWLPLKPSGFYHDAGIEMVEHRVETIDVGTRKIAMPGGASVTADGLLLAMGSHARSLPVPGAALDGVMTLRTRADCERIAERADSIDHLVVVGASFIGMESAASLMTRGVSKVTVVAPENIPFEHTLGRSVGGVFRDLHQSHGVELRLGRKVERIEGGQGVEAVMLDDGDRLEAQLVVVGIGVQPATTGVRGAELEDDGSIQVDELMRVCPGVYAAGDIATFPDWRTGERTRIEHWRTAQQQGMIAGRNLAGDVRPYRGVPFFWTMQFGMGLGYVGHAAAWDDEIVHGSLADRDFVVFYLRDGRLLAGASVGRDLQINALHELFQLGREPAASELRSGEIDLTKLLEA